MNSHMNGDLGEFSLKGENGFIGIEINEVSI